MPRRIYIFDDPDRFAAGAVGEPGQRTFFLQAVQGSRVAAVVLEKVQVALLADRIAAIVTELDRRGLASLVPPAQAADDPALEAPLREEFRVGALSIAWDDELDRLVVEARSMTDEDEVVEDVGASEVDDEADAEIERVDDVPDDAPIGPDVLRVRLAPAMAMVFAQRAARVVAAGRPPCPFCGEPLDATGHLCPRRNGATYLN